MNKRSILNGSQGGLNWEYYVNFLDGRAEELNYLLDQVL